MLVAVHVPGDTISHSTTATRSSLGHMFVSVKSARTCAEIACEPSDELWGSKLSRHNWKQREREAAALIGGARYPANIGGPFDCSSDRFEVQVKERRTLSLQQLEALVLEMDRLAAQKGKAGLVMVKRSAGSGRRTPWLVVMSQEVFRSLLS